MRTLVMIMLVAVFVMPKQAFAAIGCTLTNPAEDLKYLYPEMTTYKEDLNEFPLLKDGTELFRALREEGWRPRAHVGLGGGYALADTAQALGPELDFTLVADLPQPQIDDRFAPGVAGFAEAYRRRYGAEPRSGHSLACYAGALLFYDALQRAGGADAARLRAAILATDLPHGALPNGWGARFDERGQNGRARTVLLQWRSGVLRTVLPAEAAVAPLALPPAG